MADWSYASHQGSLPPRPVHFKPPDEGLPASGATLDDVKTENTTPLIFDPQRLDSSEEGNRALVNPTGTPREDPVLAPVFGSSTSAQSVPSVESAPSVSIPVVSQAGIDGSNSNNAQPRDCVRLEPTNGNPAIVNYPVNSSRHISPLDSKISSDSVTNEYSTGCLSPQAISTTSSAPAFPPEPTILAEKYIILGPLDATTAHAISIANHQPLHVKAVSPRTAREVCAQQSQLGDCDGVRAPVEAIVSGCGRRAWLVFPPHCGDLHSYVRLRRRLREAEAQRLFAQVVATVHSCHSAGLVLRDLKLRKFVFTDSNRQRVVLEGVEDSVVAGEADLLHDKHGCPAYVAPEILSAAAYSGRHADMWGLGVILYTMLVGRYPFHNADTSTLFARIRSGKFFIPEWVSSRARHLILSLLRRQPQRRLTASQVMVHPWLTRSPRDHVVGKDPHDHTVPGTELMTQHPLLPGKALPP